MGIAEPENLTDQEWARKYEVLKRIREAEKNNSASDLLENRK
jgi:hypothetical protein